MKRFLILFGCVLFHICRAAAQVTHPDTIVQKDVVITADDTVRAEMSNKVRDSLRHRRIKQTIRRSIFVPGWGQISNRQIWKVPIVAAAVAIPAYLFFDNLAVYKDLKQAYIYKVDTIPGNDDLIPPEYKVLSANSLKYYRDTYRQNVDYSALAFVLAWGLNIVDAAVFANLRDFDVSDKLAIKIKAPTINLVGQSSVGLVLTFKPQKKTVIFN